MSAANISVQDTAHWVALYRAFESERPDALFHDTYARELAGSRGATIMDQMPQARTYGWPMVVRTAVMDEVIVRLAPSLDAVLNLAAGLDARPYRLPLPPGLCWIEVDFAAMLDHKAGLLAHHSPVCLLERVPLDLADRHARRELFARIAAQSARVLVISEGLLVYLHAEQVGELADDLAAQRAFAHWLSDIASPFVLRLVQRAWGRYVAGGQAFKFGPEDAAAFFSAHGWRIAEYRSNLIEGDRLARMPMAWLYRLIFPRARAQEMSRRTGPMAGVVVLENANSQAWA